MHPAFSLLLLWGSLGSVVAEEPWLLFPTEEAHSFTFESDKPSLQHFQAKVPLRDSDIPLQISKEQSFNGNAQCEFERFLRAVELGPLTMWLETAQIMAFDEPSLTAVVFDQVFKILVFNRTSRAFEESVFDNLPQSLFAGSTNSTNETSEFIIKSVPSPSSSEAASPSIGILIRNATICVLDYRIGKVKLTFQADRPITSHFPLKISTVSPKGRFIVSFMDIEAEQISVFRIDLDDRHEPVLNTFISLKSLGNEDSKEAAKLNATDSVSPRASRPIVVADFAISVGTGNGNPVFLVMTSDNGLYKFFDSKGTGDYELSPFETQFIFGHSLSLVDNFAVILQHDVENNSTLLEVYKVDPDKTVLLK